MAHPSHGDRKRAELTEEFDREMPRFKRFLVDGGKVSFAPEGEAEYLRSEWDVALEEKARFALSGSNRKQAEAQASRDALVALLIEQLDHFARTWLAESVSRSGPSLIIANAARMQRGASLVVPFGSSASLLGGPASDVDLAVLLALPMEEQRRFVEALARWHFARPFDAVEATPVPLARVPICNLRHDASGLAVDVSVGNTVAIDNTLLIRTYMELDEQARQLCALVKAWAKARRLSSTRHGTPSSYAWVRRQRPSPSPPLPHRRAHAHKHLPAPQSPRPARSCSPSATCRAASRPCCLASSHPSSPRPRRCGPAPTAWPAPAGWRTPRRRTTGTA